LNLLTLGHEMNAAIEHPELGMKAPEFFIETRDDRFSLHQLAARHKNLVLTTQDSYRYHPN
jgi:hypothetical protein